MDDEMSNKKCVNIRKQRLFFVVVVLTIVSIACLGTMLFFLGQRSVPQQSSQNDIKSESKQSDSGTAVNEEFRSGTNSNNCQGTSDLKTFPNIDYAFMGYNILKGYPLADGHDPGFTYPIFSADYSNGGHTSDCRYRIPRGMIITSDVSCVTSFSSRIVQTQYEFFKTLSTYTSSWLGSQGWGFSFSGSAEFKEAVSIFSDAKLIVIYSTANCNYYICKIEKMQPPPFDSNFLKWVVELNKTFSEEEEKNLFLDFFEHYGTHFFHSVTFGASYTHEYKMSSSKYTSMRETGVDVAATASLSSTWISLQTVFQLSESKKSVANQFLENVQERTITKGAPPPANGEALTWASKVQETPIPRQYVLSSLEDLFTKEFMGSIGVKYDEIQNKIITYKEEYCRFLLEEGHVDTCIDFVDVLILKGTEILGSVKNETLLTLANCQSRCQESRWCIAIDFCNDCTRTDANYNKCQMYGEDGNHEGKSDISMETTVWMSKIERQLVLFNTAVTGTYRTSSQSNHSENVQDCMQRCLEDKHCVVFTYCNCSEKIQNCKLYAQNRIISLKAEAGSHTHFISNKINSIYDIYSTTKPTISAENKTSTQASNT